MFITSLVKSLSESPTTGKAFGAAGQAASELAVAGWIGSTCVRKEYLNAAMVQSLSKTCFSILLPMFLGTSIMTTVKRYGLNASSIAIPIVAVIHSLVLFMVSRQFLLPAFGIDVESVEGRATNVCCAFGNSGVVPLIFAEALFRNSGGDMLLNAYSKVSLYLIGWSPLFWSFGRNALLGGMTETNANVGASVVNSNEDQEKETFLKSFERMMKSVKSLISPPMVGVFFGLVVSLIPVLRCLVMSCSSEGEVEKIAPLAVVFNSCQNLGRAANPLALLVLTASLALGNMKSNSTAGLPENVSDLGIPLLRRWKCVSIARFALSPLLMVIMLKLLHHFGVIGSITSKNDAMTWFILILQASMPCAQNSVLMLQVAEKTTEASRLARFLFSMYATAMIPIVIVSTIMLEKCNFVA